MNNASNTLPVRLPQTPIRHTVESRAPTDCLTDPVPSRIVHRCRYKSAVRSELTRTVISDDDPSRWPRMRSRIAEKVPAGNWPPRVQSMMNTESCGDDSSPESIGTQPRPIWDRMSDSSPSRRASSVSTASARIGSVPDEPPVSECSGWSPGASYGRPYSGVSGTSDHHHLVDVTDVVPHVADRRVRRPHRL